MPVRLNNIDVPAVAHPVSTADDMRQVDRVVGQGGQFST